MMTKDNKYFDIVCDKEEDVVGNLRIICGNCKSEISIVMSLLYNKKHSSSRVDKCPHCEKLNLVWDRDYVYA